MLTEDQINELHEGIQQLGYNDCFNILASIAHRMLSFTPDTPPLDAIHACLTQIMWSMKDQQTYIKKKENGHGPSDESNRG